MNWLFRRHFWIVHLVLLSIVAFIMAKTLTVIAGYWLSKSIPEKPRASFFREPEPVPEDRDFDLANERNLFKAKREPVSLDEEAEINTGRWQDAMPSTLPLKLVSTMVFMDPFDSRAVIQDMSGNRSDVFSLSDCDQFRKTYDQSKIETVLPEQSWVPARPCKNIFGMATLVRIEEYRVYIFNERDRKYEYLSLLADDKGPIRRPPPMETGGGEGEGVRKVGPTSYEIERGEFDRALSNVARLMTEARAVPEMDANGNYVGFKLIYIKDGSLFEKIGIEKMDVLTRINGYELKNPETALQLFGKLRTANQFTIDVNRGGRPVTLDYSVR